MTPPTGNAAPSQRITFSNRPIHCIFTPALIASAGVEGVDDLYEEFKSNGANIVKPLQDTDWGTRDFYIEDPDGYIICFGGQAG